MEVAALELAQLAPHVLALDRLGRAAQLMRATPRRRALDDGDAIRAARGREDGTHARAALRERLQRRLLVREPRAMAGAVDMATDHAKECASLAFSISIAVTRYGSATNRHG